MGEVNDASATEGTTIIDSNHRGPSVVKVGDANAGAERQISVGCRQGARTEDFTTGRAISIKPWAIPAGLTDLNSSG